MTRPLSQAMNTPKSTLVQGVGRSNPETDTSRRPDLLGYLAVLVASACWGTSGIFVKFIMANAEVTALALAFWRDLFTFLVLFIGIKLFRPAWLHVQRRDLPWLIGLGGSLGIFHVFWNLGVFLNGAAVATVQQAAMPAIVAIVAWVIWREPLTWNKILAIALTFTGTVLVSGLDALVHAELTLPGLLAGLGIPFTYASWNLFGKKVRENYNPLVTLTFGFAFGALVLLPFQFSTPQPWPVPAMSWFWFAGLILISTISAFSTYMFGLGRLPASVATILAMAEIPIVAFYTYAFLNEYMTVDQVIGALLVIGGVLILSWRKRRSLPSPDTVRT
jgi:DME family drug/metabolite transporter